MASNVVSPFGSAGAVAAAQAKAAKKLAPAVHFHRQRPGSAYEVVSHPGAKKVEDTAEYKQAWQKVYDAARILHAAPVPEYDIQKVCLERAREFRDTIEALRVVRPSVPESYPAFGDKYQISAAITKLAKNLVPKKAIDEQGAIKDVYFPEQYTTWSSQAKGLIDILDENKPVEEGSCTLM